jgi:hypothetical protein
LALGGRFDFLLDIYDRVGADHPSATALTSAIFRAKKDLRRQVKKGEISREKADELTRRYYRDFNNTLYYHRMWSGVLRNHTQSCAVFGEQVTSALLTQSKAKR